ncbi:20S proteasome subunit beta 2 [Fonticula alba]|uniref:Proteasome subunit beta n=1 Tax=Fonticula alba TaxID=691883 RepID=A0A058ZAJ0_FONAL|nr:20S proteasome subunit beta 2 [Fonticula alba]KCV71390.1 20S proteasome subunit beta 2 [Fonticula alba]|eukprot:XP_009494513.1 20S proteasome subunit beta 2 [Fonticula alba]
MSNANNTPLPAPASYGGFTFENTHRNALLTRMGYDAPNATKTGTTIAGIVFKGGVMLGADTRSTSGSIVADKNCEKIHRISSNIFCCGAGTAADTENVTGMVEAKLRLHELKTGRKARVVNALTLLKQHLFRYQGHVSAALVLGGVDHTGPRLHTVAPHGSTDTLPYVTMGSGSLAAMSIFESRWKPDMSFDEAAQLVGDSIRAGIFHDLGSGSNVDLTAIYLQEDGTVAVKIMRNIDCPNPKPAPVLNYKYPTGTTAVLTKEVKPFSQLAEVTAISRTIFENNEDDDAAPPAASAPVPMDIN